MPKSHKLPLLGAAVVRRMFEAMVPNPRLRLMDQVRKVLRLESFYPEGLLRIFRWIGVQAWGDSSIRNGMVIGGEHRHTNQAPSGAACVWLNA
jgi:hypothetical protein